MPTKEGVLDSTNKADLFTFQYLHTYGGLNEPIAQAGSVKVGALGYFPGVGSQDEMDAAGKTQAYGLTIFCMQEPGTKWKASKKADRVDGVNKLQTLMSNSSTLVSAIGDQVAAMFTFI